MSDFMTGFRFAPLLVAALFFLFYFAPDSEASFNPEQVQCFPMPSTAGLMPTVKPVGLHEADPIESGRLTMATHIAKVVEAETHCSPEFCDAIDRKSYRSAIFFYVAVRENISRNKFREKGEAGLSQAARIFDTSGDSAVIANLKKMHNAGLIDLSTLGTAKQSAALLVLKPLKSYRPCPDETPKKSN
jgi:hypothetical protein